jgi:tRNA G10  N-methylase Trm11
MAELLDGYQRVLDPFAGTGRIHELADHDTVGVELEPEWAAMHQRTHEGSALALPFRDEEFDAITTSPTYGNRLADSYNASDPEARRSYRFDLGHELSPNNSGALQWGPAYREFHEKAWLEALRVLRPGGRFVLDIKDHIRDGKWQDVTGWHVRELTELGLSVCAVRPVVTTGLGGTGSNSSLRTGAELVIGFDKP